MNKQAVLIISDFISPRLTYVCRVLFNSILKCGFQLTLDKENAQNTSTTINYSNRIVQGALNVQPHKLLQQKGIEPQKITSGTFEKLPTLFHTKQGDIPFDIFSAMFYLLTRYEEYLPFQPDKHGRFSSKESIASRHQFYNRPIVELWAKQLAEKLKLPFPNKTSTPPITIDIDYTWKYKHKGMVKFWGSLLKKTARLDFKAFSEQIEVALRLKNDPFETYSYLKKIAAKEKTKLLYFVLVGNKHKNDTAFPLTNKHHNQQLVKLKEQAEIGLHPSYQSNTKTEELEQEKEKLENILETAINKSRQHYLVLKLPETYNNLLKHGILNDYSMGWHDTAGFRAGISRAYPFYHLEKESTSTLTIHPFVTMDRTLKDYMELNKQEALQEIKDLKNKVNEIGGTMITIWHNDSVSNTGEWKGWRTIFEESVQ